jgi:TadE-like protein
MYIKAAMSCPGTIEFPSSMTSIPGEGSSLPSGEDVKRYTRRGHYTRGVAAAEFALLLPLVVILMAFPLYIGWYQYHVIKAQTAAQNTVRFLSKIPISEMSNPFRAPVVVGVAQRMADVMLAELKPGYFPPTVTILCNGAICSGNIRPTTVSVNIQMTVYDIFFPNVTQLSAPIFVTAQLPYMGR